MAKSSPQPPGEHASLDDVSAERLLRGQRPTPGAPASEQAVYEVLAAASAPPTARELSGEARAVAAFTATRPATTGPRHARHVIRRRRFAARPRVSHGVAAAAALGALTLGGVAAAAYTGSLPSSIQRLAHDHIGAPHGKHPHPSSGKSTLHPKPTNTALRSGRPTGTAPQPGLSAMTPTVRPTPSGPSTRRPSSTPLSQRYQLCTDYVSARVRHDERAADKAWKRLEKAAGGREHVWAYCEPVWRGSRPDGGNPDPHDPPRPKPSFRTVPESPIGRPPS